MNLPRKFLVLAICISMASTITARARRRVNNFTTPSFSAPVKRTQPKGRIARRSKPTPYRVAQRRTRQAPNRIPRQVPAKLTHMQGPTRAPLNKSLLQDDPMSHYKAMVIKDINSLLCHNKMAPAWAYLNSSDTVLLKDNSKESMLQEIITNAKKTNNEQIMDQLVNLSLAAPTSQDFNLVLRVMTNNPEVFGEAFYAPIAKSPKLNTQMMSEVEQDIQFHMMRTSLQKNNLLAVQNLLEAGLNANAQDKNWVNKQYWKSMVHPDFYAASRPIEFAIDSNNPALVSLLIDYGAEIDPIKDVLNPHENSMLQRTIRRGKLTNNLNNSKKIISLLVDQAGWVPTCYAKNMIFITKEMPTAEKLKQYQVQYETNKLETVFQVRSDLIAIAPEVNFSVK